MNIYREEQIGEGWFSIPRYNLALSVNLYTKYELSVLYICGDIFDEKYREKEKRTNTGKNN